MGNNRQKKKDSLNKEDQGIGYSNVETKDDINMQLIKDVLLDDEQEFIFDEVY